MMNGANGMTPADMAAVLRNEDGFGNNGNWIWIFLIFAIFGGWGGNRWDNNSGINDNYVLASDFATMQRQVDSAAQSLERKGDGISNGLCDGFYTQAQLINGTNMNLAEGFARAELIQANNLAMLQKQLSDCCCQNRYDALQNTYNLQKSIDNGFCQTNFNAVQNTRDVIDNQHAGTLAILNKLNDMENNAKDERIAKLMADNQALRFSQSQIAQNAYIVNQLKPPTPVPAFVVPGPYYNNSTTATSPTIFPGTTIA